MAKQEDKTGLTELETTALSEDTRSLGITVPQTVEEHKRSLIEMENALTRAAAQQGLMFLALKERIEHGEFESWIDSAGFNARTVRRKMQTAKFLLNQPKELQPKLIGLSQQKLTELAKSDPDILDQIAESGEDIDDFTQLSFVDMRERIRTLENKNTNLEIDLESAAADKKALTNKLKRLNEHAEYPDYVMATRHESNALAEQALLCLDDLERLSTELTQNPSQDGQHFKVAVNSLYRHVNATAMRATQILAGMKIEFSDLIDFELNIVALPDEIETAVNLRRELISAHEQEKILREDQRERAKPKKAGRPKKSKAAK